MIGRKKGNRVPRRRSSRGALALIAALFLASGILRLADGTGEAIAESIGRLTEEHQPTPASAPETCEMPEGIDELLAALQEREDKIVARETALEERLKMLEVVEKRVKREIAALKQAQADLDKTIALADGAAEKDISRLTAMYENMKPKAAAAVFEAMDPEFSAGFLGRMRPDAAAAILANLDPKKAYTISVVLAGRNANTPSD